MVRSLYQNESELQEAIKSAFNRVLGWRELCLTEMVEKSYILYSLLLAIIAVESKWPTLQQVISDSSGKLIHDNAEINLTELSDEVFSDIEQEDFRDFKIACSKMTNTKDQRENTDKMVLQRLLQNLIGKSHHACVTRRTYGFCKEVAWLGRRVSVIICAMCWRRPQN